MTIDPNWGDWIYRSCAKHFFNNVEGIHLHVEGAPRNTTGLNEWLEFRLDGPFYKHYTKDHYRADVEINILIAQLDSKTPYRIHKMCGIVEAAFHNNIPVYRYGDITDNIQSDGSHLGCLVMQAGPKETVRKSFFGKVRPDSNLMQASVEGHYQILLNNPGVC